MHGSSSSTVHGMLVKQTGEFLSIFKLTKNKFTAAGFEPAMSNKVTVRFQLSYKALMLKQGDRQYYG